jgi:hypothetical protein
VLRTVLPRRWLHTKSPLSRALCSDEHAMGAVGHELARSARCT